MTVSAILKEKSRGILTITAASTLGEAVTQLASHRIGAIIVADAAGKVVEGIISERDVVRLISERGTEVLTTPLADVMTRAVVTCSPDDTIPVIMETMTNGRFRHMPVVCKQNGLVGIISIGDVVKFRVEEMERDQAALRDYIMTA